VLVQEPPRTRVFNVEKDLKLSDKSREGEISASLGWSSARIRRCWGASSPERISERRDVGAVSTSDRARKGPKARIRHRTESVLVLMGPSSEKSMIEPKK